MKEKVIFDTNIIKNSEINTFFGGRKELELFMQDAEIIIPYTVIEEIKRQKRVSLKNKRDSFITNPFHKLRSVSEDETKSFDIDAYIQKLIDEETITFEIIDLKTNDCLPLMKEMALLKKAPFESKDGTDKGFKDALIYFSVLEYLQEIPDRYVFVCAKDNLLGEAFKDNPNVIVIKDYDEFKQHSISQFFDDYFIEKLNEELSISIDKDNIKEYWNNIDDNKVVLIEIEGQEYVIETDAGEIIGFCKTDEYKEEVDSLVSSPNFNSTDRIVENLLDYSNYFSSEEILKILDATYYNSQINWIVHKPQIKQLIGPLYSSRKDFIQDSLVATFLKSIF